MWQNCQSRSFQHNETNTISASLPVYCYSSSYRYFKFDFKTLCNPMMREYGNDITSHYWCWKCVHCTSEMQEPRQGRVPLLKNLKLGYWSLWHRQYSMAVHVTGGPWQIWQDIPQAHWQLGGNVGTGNCRQAFSYMFEGWSGIWYGGGGSPAIQRPKWLGNFFIPFCVFTFSFFPVLYVFVLFSFERIFTFPFPFVLTDSLFFR